MYEGEGVKKIKNAMPGRCDADGIARKITSAWL